jgi:hypothetical protein
MGQIHESFIIAAGRDGLWIIDQHVAHERVLFEKVLKQRAAGRVETQALLMPLILQLTAEQQIEYARIADELQSIGFETEPFGARTIAVKAAPAAVPVSDLEKLIFRDPRDGRRRDAWTVDGRYPAQHRRVDRLPRGDQNQYAAGSKQDGVAARRAGGNRLPHELPARQTYCAAVSDPRDFESISSYLSCVSVGC